MKSHWSSSNFDELVNFVEIEKAWMYSISSDGPMNNIKSLGTKNFFVYLSGDVLKLASLISNGK